MRLTITNFDKIPAPETNIKAALTRETAPALFTEILHRTTHSGEHVNFHNVSKVPTALGAINLLANDISSLPLRLFVRTSKGPQYAVSHPLFRILHDAWSNEMTAREGMEYTVRMLITTGNYFNLLKIGPKGISSIIPLFAPNMSGREFLDDAGNSSIVWDYVDPITGKVSIIPDSLIWRGHVNASRSLMGESSLMICRETVGTALAAAKASAHLFKQGTITDGYFSADPGMDLSSDDWKDLIKTWANGASGAYRKLVLPPGIKLNKIDLLNAVTAQFIERMQHSDLEICRILNIPASILDASLHASKPYEATESQRRWYVDHTLRPYLVLFEQSINLRCLLPSERDRFYSEFDTDSFLDADMQARYEGYHLALTDGWMNRNEVRAKEGLSKVPGLDNFLIATNNYSVVNPDGTVSVNARAEKIVEASIERIVRKESKSGKYDAAFVADVLCLPVEACTQYCESRRMGTLNDSQAKEHLLTLIKEGQNHDSDECQESLA